tara:strand:- start:7074 stop:8153 length:1080 start_codon:yes stop_codon:yes gene_type:complete
MAISPDVVATALNELMPAYSELFTSWHPILEKIVQNGNMSRSVAQGPLREFAVVAGGPGSITQISTGSEVISGGRNQQASRGTVKAPRLIYAFDVPGKDLAEANGEMDLAKILKNYPELALSDFHERIANQLGSGNGTGAGGFVTLNGDKTYTPDGPSATAENGIFDFADSQTDSVFGLVKSGDASGVAGWHNQYKAITTNFATTGLSTMREIYHKCSRQGKAQGPVDLMLGDEASYLNYIEALDDQVRVAEVTGDKTPNNVKMGVKFLNANFFLEDSIDITQYSSGSANNGVIYMLKTPTWHSYTLGHDSGMESKGDFALRGPFRIPEQDVWRYELVLSMGLYCNQLRANGVVTNGAT